MTEVRCQTLPAPSRQAVEVSACNLKADSEFGAMGRFGPGYPLLAENCKSCSRDTSPKSQAEYNLPSSW